MALAGVVQARRCVDQICGVAPFAEPVQHFAHLRATAVTVISASAKVIKMHQQSEFQRFRLLPAGNRQSRPGEVGRRQNVLLEVSIGKEPTKAGVSLRCRCAVGTTDGTTLTYSADRLDRISANSMIFPSRLRD